MRTMSDVAEQQLSLDFGKHEASASPDEAREATEQQAFPPFAVVGPTASGKSDLSIALAKAYHGEIIGADSMQLYRGMDIGTAKLPRDQRGGVPHTLIDIWDVTEPASVAEYQVQAVAAAEDMMARNVRPIIVGGSMLYVQSLIDDWKFPPTSPEVRAHWERRLADVGVKQLHDILATIDPSAAAIIEDNDPRRTVRALEVIELTGQPFTASQPPINAPARWSTIILGLATTPEWLNPRIEKRTAMMFERGFVEEVAALKEAGLVPGSTAGMAIGYAQVLDYLDGKMSLDEAMEKTITGTRRYVRRQRSWFKRDPRVNWIDASGDTFAQAQEILRGYGIEPQ